MLCLRGFELYSRWVPLVKEQDCMLRVLPAHDKLALQQVTYTSAYEVATARVILSNQM